MTKSEINQETRATTWPVAWPTNADIEDVWQGLEWRDLSPLHGGFQAVLRQRFARAILARFAGSALFDVEAMLADCVPGGSICDPQGVADAIREWFGPGTTSASAGQGAEPNLPPLPWPEMPRGSMDYFSTSQMRNYARAARRRYVAPAESGSEADLYRFLRDGGQDDTGNGPWCEAYRAIGSSKPAAEIDAIVTSALKRELREGADCHGS